MLTKLLSLLLALATPMAQAQQIALSSGTLDASDLKGLGGPIWDRLATKLYEDEGISPIPEGEREELSRYFFADYLGYLNAIGLELASFENALISRKEIKDQGQCSDDTIKAFNDLLTNSVQSDLYTFTDTYCSNACRRKAELDFGLIAEFDQPKGLPQTCADRAREMYDTYHCNMAGEDSPILRDSDLTGGAIVLPPNLGTHSSVAPGGPESKLIPKDIKDTTSRIDPDLPARGGASGSGVKIISVPKLPLISRTAEVDRGFKNVLSKQKKVCKQKRSDLLRQTFAPYGSSSASSSSTSPVRNPNDPRWTTTDETKQASEDKLEKVLPKNPACKSSGPEMYDRFAILRAAYNRIANVKIVQSLNHWPIYDDNGVVDRSLQKSIRSTADRFFHSLLNEIETQNRRACGAGGTSLVADYTTGDIIPGQSHKVTIRDIPTGTVQMPGEEPEEPETVATYFSANIALVDALINGVTLGSEATGAGTITEVVAGQIAAGVKDGTIPPEEIGNHIARGPYGKNVEEIEKLTRLYLSQGNYYGLKVFAAELLGGLVSGGAVAGVAKGTKVLGSKLAMSISSGRISTIFHGLREIIMRPFGVLGGQVGSWSIGGKAWTFGTFKSTAKWESQLVKRGWTRKAIDEALSSGKSFPAVNMVNKSNGAVRYVHPVTGKSVVIDTITGEILHVGGLGFVY
jgi:hypothetical protein